MSRLAATALATLLSASLLLAAPGCGPGGSVPDYDAATGDGGGGRTDAGADAAGQQDGAPPEDAAADAAGQQDAAPQQDAQADTVPAVGCYGFLVHEIQTQGTQDSDEYVEIAGPVGGDLANHRVVYREGAGTTDVTLIAFSTGDVIPASGFVVIAANTWIGGDAGVQAFKSYLWSTAKNLSTTGGGVALRRGASDTGVIVDSVGYGSATNAFVKGTAAAAPPAGKSASRSPRCENTGNNADDFSWVNPSPGR